MFFKPLKEITEADLDALVENKVQETKAIEFKRDLPGVLEDDKREFLADTTSFANTGGGDLLFGVDAPNGVAVKIVGVEVRNLDAEKLRLENLLRDCVAPRLPSALFESISLANGRSVLILRVQQSWNSPHRVTFRNHGKFYGRNSAGKYELDVVELRAAFVGSEGLAERIRRFREDRLAKIVARETPYPLKDGPAAALHVLPLSSFTSNETVAFHKALDVIIPPGARGWHDVPNLDGVIFENLDDLRSYVQLFRSGMIETVVVYEPHGEPPMLPSLAMANHCIVALEQNLRFLSANNVAPPVFVFLSLLEVRDYRLGVRDTFRLTPRPLDRNNLIFAEVRVDGFDADAASILRPILDLLANAYGLKRFEFYDAQGQWSG